MAAKFITLTPDYYINSDRIISVEFYPKPLMYCMMPVYAKVIYANDFGQIETVRILDKALAGRIKQQLNERNNN